MYASASAADSTSWHTVVLKSPVLSHDRQVDYDDPEDSINVTVPSANAGMIVAE